MPLKTVSVAPMLHSRGMGLKAAPPLPVEALGPGVHPETRGVATQTIWMDCPAGMILGRERVRVAWKGRADLVDVSQHTAHTAPLTEKTQA